jgi:hypothetical protein
MSASMANSSKSRARGTARCIGHPAGQAWSAGRWVAQLQWQAGRCRAHNTTYAPAPSACLTHGQCVCLFYGGQTRRVFMIALLGAHGPGIEYVRPANALSSSSHIRCDRFPRRDTTPRTDRVGGAVMSVLGWPKPGWDLLSRPASP